MGIVLTFSFALIAMGRPQPAAQVIPPQPQRITFCQLAASPETYDKKLVQLDGLITFGFENFHFVDPSCPTPSFSVWITYGGKAASNAVYCCPGEGGQGLRTDNLSIDGVEVLLTDDSVFRQFTALLAKERDTMVRATIVGRFFAGKESPDSFGRGFGHFGCCSLLAIQQIVKFEPHIRRDLDYSAEAGWYEDVGCNATSLRYLRHVSFGSRDRVVEEVMEEQRMVDTGGRSWAAVDPMRVAADSLKPFYGTQEPVLRRVKSGEARQVFRWRNGKTSVVVVVAKPYWVSLYAKSPATAWVATTIKEAQCR
jgi:hypothetical protein